MPFAQFNASQGLKNIFDTEIDRAYDEGLRLYQAKALSVNAITQKFTMFSGAKRLGEDPRDLGETASFEASYQA